LAFRRIEALCESLGDHAIDWPGLALLERCAECRVTKPGACGRAIGINIRQRTRDGAQVVRARVYTDGTTQRVCYLERFKAPVQARLANELKKAQQANQPAATAFASAAAGPFSIEVKAPGAASWTPINTVDQASKVISQLQASSGGRLTPVEP